MEDPQKANIVTGDVNICARKQRNSQLIKSMLDENYELKTKTATHVKGGHIDHTYTKNAIAQLRLYTPYYSDHDALCVAVEQARVSTEWVNAE